MAISGALIGRAIGSFGKKPKIPALTDISPELTQQATTAGNIATLPQAQQLASSVNLFNQQELDKMLERALPGARSKIESNLASLLSGEIPESILTGLRRSSAERGIASGTTGSGFNLGRELGSQLGMSLQLAQQGFDSAQRWLSQTTAPTFDVSSMFFTPQQRLSFEVQQQGAKYGRDLLAAQVKAAPDPATAALGQEVDRFFNTVASASMSYAGGMIGGGMGGGGGAALSSAGGGRSGMSGMQYLGSAQGQSVSLGQSNIGNTWGNWLNSIQ